MWTECRFIQHQGHTRGVRMFRTEEAIRPAAITVSGVHGIKMAAFSVIATIYDLEEVVTEFSALLMNWTNIMTHFV